MNEFAPYIKINGCFMVLNISPQVKTIKIFNYPILYGQTRDLLQIPGIGEGDIRASLLKGELNHKIRAKDIVITCCDIDLLQFNNNHRAFLQSAGITTGFYANYNQLSPDVVSAIEGGGAGGITASRHETLRQLIHFIDNGPGDGFTSGAVRQTLPFGASFPTQIVWFTDGTLAQKIVEKIITYNGNQVPSTIVWNMYDTDGATIIHSITDVISYTNNVFETTRVRAIT